MVQLVVGSVQLLSHTFIGRKPILTLACHEPMPGQFLPLLKLTLMAACTSG
jgi:hypothetical protein